MKNVSSVCQEAETYTHAFLLCEREQMFWRKVTSWLNNSGYHDFRLEHTIVILGDTEKGKLSN